MMKLMIMTIKIIMMRTVIVLVIAIITMRITMIIIEMTMITVIIITMVMTTKKYYNNINKRLKQINNTRICLANKKRTKTHREQRQGKTDSPFQHQLFLEVPGM